MRDNELEQFLQKNDIPRDNISNLMQYYREHNIEVLFWWLK